MTAAALLVKELQARGVTSIATLCGHGLDPLFHAARQAGLRLVDTRNEQTASYIADACGKLTGRPGVCAVSSGVAVGNAFAGLMNAWFDGSPMLLISGSASTETAGQGHFQDIDQAALAAPITSFSQCIERPEDVTAILGAAFAVGGPAHIMFPMNVQNAEAGPQTARLENAPAPRPGATPEEVSAALDAAHRPLIVAGSGVFYAREGATLLELCERCSIPVVVPIWDRGSIDRASPAFQGVIGAATGGPRLLPDADCVILAGVVSDYRVGYRPAHAIRFDGAWSQVRPLARHDAWLAEASRRRAEFRASIERTATEQAAEGLHARDLMAALRRILNQEGMLLIDGGSIGQWAHQLLCDRYPGHWLTCGRSGVVGWGIGGAMAARLTYPDRQVVLLSGDGALTFNIADIECAVRQKLPFVILLADDQSWGITKTGHERQFGEAISSTLGPIQFARLAESLGARAITASTPEEVEAALKTAVESGEVTLVHAPIVGGNP